MNNEMQEQPGRYIQENKGKIREATLKAIDEDAENERKYTKELADKQWQRTYATFGGMDIVAYFEGVVVGELQAITWRRNYVNFGKTPKVEGTFIIAEFGESPLELIPKFNMMRDITGTDRPKGDIVLFYNNEFGNKAYRLISGVSIVEEAGGIDIDDMITEVTYMFVADDISPLREIRNEQQVWELMAKYHM